MSYWQLYYHLVWATKGREPWIDDDRNGLLVRSFQASCTEMRVLVHAIGIMPDHVHLALSIPPRVAVADFVKTLKGTTSFRLNEDARRDGPARFSWQPEYGVLSFGERSLSDVVRYIENQPAHHAANSLWPTFETTERPFVANSVGATPSP